MKAWKVLRPDPAGWVPTPDKLAYMHVDTVFYDNACDADWVRKTLIEHDGYQVDIEVVPEKHP